MCTLPDWYKMGRVFLEEWKQVSFDTNLNSIILILNFYQCEGWLCSGPDSYFDFELLNLSFDTDPPLTRTAILWTFWFDSVYISGFIFDPYSNFLPLTLTLTLMLILTHSAPASYTNSYYRLQKKIIINPPYLTVHKSLGPCSVSQLIFINVVVVASYNLLSTPPPSFSFPVSSGTRWGRGTRESGVIRSHWGEVNLVIMLKVGAMTDDTDTEPLRRQHLWLLRSSIFDSFFFLYRIFRKLSSLNIDSFDNWHRWISTPSTMDVVKYLLLRKLTSLDIDSDTWHYWISTTSTIDVIKHRILRQLTSLNTAFVYSIFRKLAPLSIEVILQLTSIDIKTFDNWHLLKSNLSTTATLNYQFFKKWPLWKANPSKFDT